MQPQKVEHFERLSSAAVGMNIWGLTVSAPMSRVLAPNYFDRFAERQPRRGDRIMVTSDFEGVLLVATLLVESNDKGSVKVREL
jgi:hypothetical protein